MAEVEAIHADPCIYDTEPRAKPRRTRKNRHQRQRWIGINRPRNIVLNQQSSTIINTSITNTSSHQLLNNNCNTALNSRHTPITLAINTESTNDFKQDSHPNRPSAQQLPQCSSSQRSSTAASHTSPEPSPRASLLTLRASGRVNILKSSNSHSTNNHQGCTTTMPGICTRAGVMDPVDTSAMARGTEI